MRCLFIFYLKKLNDIITRVTHLAAFKFYTEHKILACVRRLTSINPEPRSHPYIYLFTSEKFKFICIFLKYSFLKLYHTYLRAA